MCATDPIIFSGLKALTLADSCQQSLLRLALEGISVCRWIADSGGDGADVCSGFRSIPLIRRLMLRLVASETGWQTL